MKRHRQRRVVDSFQIKRGSKWILTIEVPRRGKYEFVFAPEPISGADKEYAAAELERWLPHLDHEQRYALLWE